MILLAMAEYEKDAAVEKVITLGQFKELYCVLCSDCNTPSVQHIYYVSLTRKILNERRRLIYRDVYDIFMKKFDKVEERLKAKVV